MEFKEQFIVKGFDYKGELIGEQYRENYPSEKSIGLFLKAHPTVDYCKVDKVFKKVRPYSEQRTKELLFAQQVAKEVAKLL